MQIKNYLSAALLGLLLVSAIPSYAQTDGRNDRTNSVEAWKKKIVAQLASKRAFPPAAVGQNGTAEVSFAIDRQGKLISRALVKSSGSELLDAAALTMVEQASPFPEAPVEATDDMLAFRVPVVFATWERPDTVKAWDKKIVARLESKRVFPPAAVGQNGTAEVRFVIDRQGKLISRALVKSSGSEVIDTAALTMVEQASPFPEAPAEATDDMLTIKVPFAFATKIPSWAEQQAKWDEREAKLKAKVNGVCRGC